MTNLTLNLCSAASLAVIGHVELVEFLRVPRVPAAGEIVHATARFAEPAGGGGVAAVQLARLSGSATLFCALGDDDLGRRSAARLVELGVRVLPAWRTDAQRRAVTIVDDDGERTIIVIGHRHAPTGADDLPWEELAACDAVYVTAADAAALRAARRARILVATPRIGPALAAAGVELDALVSSARDPNERYAAGDLDPEPRIVVSTDGVSGGSYACADGRTGTWQAAPLLGPVVDTYGAGDTFAAGLTLGLGAGLAVQDAVALAAQCAAASITGAGPYGTRLNASVVESERCEEVVDGQPESRQYR